VSGVIYGRPRELCRLRKGMEDKFERAMRPRYLSFPPWLLLLLAAFLAGCGSSGSDPESAKTPAPGWHEETLRHGGLARQFRSYDPENPPGTVPIVVVLHGGTQSMNEIFAPGAGGTRE